MGALVLSVIGLGVIFGLGILLPEEDSSPKGRETQGGLHRGAFMPMLVAFFFGSLYGLLIATLTD